MNVRHEHNKLVGARVRRVEDPKFLRGRGRYVGDIQRPGMLHAAFLRSDVAHARLIGVDTAAATDVPGVVSACTAADLEGLVRPMKAVSSMPGYQACEMPALATDRVRFVGQAVAVVCADSRAAAEDGVEALVAEYIELPAVTTIAQALAPDAPQLHDTVAGNLYNHFHLVHGDVEGAFAAADFTLDLTFRSQRCAPVPLEARAVVAEWDPDADGLTVWCSHQAPHVYRTGLAEFLGIAESCIRVIAPDVGGGFGAKLIVYPEDLAVIAVSQLTGRAVKWTSDRREDLLTSMHGREQEHRIQAAVRNDGRVLGVRADIRASNGAYAPWPFTAGLDSGQASENVTGPYDIAAYEREVRAVATCKAPMGPYRGVGRVAACFSIERTMDEIARRLELDSLEVRRRNVVRDYPYDTAAGLCFESGSSAESLEKMEQLLALPALREQHRALRQRGTHRGLGLAAVVEMTALGPAEVARKGIDMVLGFETALIRVEPDGAVTVLVGTHSHGQGHETTFAQLAADELSVPLERVRVRFGDTAAAPYGLGTWASRSQVYAGGAMMLAANDIREKMKAIAAHRLEVALEDVEFHAGRVSVRGVPDLGLDFDEIARIATHKPNLLPPDIDPGLEFVRRYRAPDPGTFSNALHAAEVEVEVDTGLVRILRYVVVEDCGTLVNPMIVDGQVHGGVAQGIGQALLEEAAYDAQGQFTAATLADYLLPSFTDVPNMEVHHLETPSPHSLGGFKGMGEGGAINAPAAIANAVSDALSPFGVFVDHTPLTPDWIVEQVLAARREQR